MNDHIFEENPNPNAKIAFVMFYPFQFYPLKNVYFQFENEAEFIIDWESGTSNLPEAAFRKSIDLLKKKQVFFRILYKENYEDPVYLNNFFSNYKALVGLRFHDCFNLHCNVSKKKIKIEYGVGKDLITFHPEQTKFDLILAQGKHQHDLLKFYTACDLVGDAKLDDWFNRKLDQESIKSLKGKIDPAKKTILYLPTHGHLSSAFIFKDILRDISSQYNILIKFHLLTPYEDQDLIEYYSKNKNFIIFDDTTDSLTLFNVCDAVLSDNSSAMFEALLLEKPLILGDFWDENFFKKHATSRSYRNKPRWPGTYFGSVEQVFKRQFVNTIRSPDDLMSVIAKTLINGADTSQGTEKLLSSLYAFNDGECSLRSKKSIENFINSRQSDVKPTLYHIFNTFCDVGRYPENGIVVKKIRVMSLAKKTTFLLKALFN